jgi:chromosome segregation ATPase
MSRASDTRARTRETAARLVSAGRRPHELTVDLIYAEIRQGSRTTINDELKAWKDEQTRTDAFSATLPREVAEAMIATWTLAVENGEKVFEQRREEVEASLATVSEQQAALEARLADREEQAAELRTQWTAGVAEIERLRIELGSALAAAEIAQIRGAALEEQLQSSRAEADRRMAAARSEFDQRLAELQGAMAAQEKEFHTEIDRATERLEGVQKQVMTQVAEARETARQTEMQLTNTRQRSAELSAEVLQLRAQLELKTQEQERIESDLAREAAKADRLQAERESLLGEVAMLTGRIGAQVAQIESLERRATNAETRLEKVLQRPATHPRNSKKASRSAVDNSGSAHETGKIVR